MKNEKRIEELLSELLNTSDQQRESMNEVVSILRMHTEYLKNISERLK